ncbi:hypothetical protein PanWU01x14_019430 [Parasponia andersonii]|uniref:Uncharacterized protein n=1 Tax=Parasponia andersonii TaxID=3476 RepID=A0A2P5DYD0_PARAD|nr:hypothetical protein PanWU01x14_019430 [Parasponia andersonii]
MPFNGVINPSPEVRIFPFANLNGIRISRWK